MRQIGAGAPRSDAGQRGASSWSTFPQRKSSGVTALETSWNCWHHAWVRGHLQAAQFSSFSRIWSMPPVSTTRRLSSSAPKGSAVARAHTDRLSVRIPVSAGTLAGFRAWALSDEFPEYVRAAFIGQRPAHQNKPLGNELIDKCGVLFPKWLLSRALRSITVRTS